MILEILDFHAATNQGRWSMPKLEIGQYCPIRIRIKCTKLQVFLKLWTWASCEIRPNLTFLESGPTLGPTYLPTENVKKNNWSGQFDNFSTPPQV